MTPIDPAKPTRRKFLRRAAWTVAGCGAAALGYAVGVEPHWFEIVTRDLPIAHLPASLEGKTLLQLSDLHIGPQVDDSYLLRAFRAAAELGPDLVVMTGDFMTSRRQEEADHVCRVVEHMPRGRLATLGITGNHDYGEHYTRIAVADLLERRLEKQGLPLLRNSQREVAGLTIAGVEDLWSPAFAPGEVLPTLKRDRANLVLCHNPDAADLPVWSGYQGWILAGHTHGGQCRIPGFSPPLLPVSNPRYVAGEVDLGDGRRLYISRGLGHLLQARFFVRPEMTLFTLKSA